MRTLAAFLVALAVLVADIPSAGASQADLVRAQRRANQALYLSRTQASDDLPEALASEGHGAEAELGHE